MRKRFLLIGLFGLCLWTVDGSAQTSVQRMVEAVGNPPLSFEGEITVTSMQTSVGSRLGDRLSYNGKHIDRKVYKNGNLHLTDMRMHIHYIANRAENRCIVYSDETKSGVEYPLDKMPETQLESVAIQDYRVTTNDMKVDSNCIYSQKQASVMNFQCEASKNIYTAQYQTALAKGATGKSETTIESWKCVEPKYKGMIMKQILDQKYDFRAVVTTKSATFFSASVTDIKELSVSDSEFQVPSGYQMIKVRTFWTAQNKLKDIFKETEKLLKKKKEHPTQLEDNDTFETEGEWED